MSLHEHEQRILYNIRKKPKIRELPKFVDVNICLGGEFKVNNGISEYCGGTVYTKYCAWLHELSVCNLRVDVETAMSIVYNGSVASKFSMWYKAKGEDLKYFNKLIECSEDLDALIDGRDWYERVTIYVVEYWDGGKKKGDYKKKGKVEAKTKVKTDKIMTQPKPLTIGSSPIRRSPRFDYGPVVYILPPNHPDIPRSSPQPKFTKSNEGSTLNSESKGKSIVKVNSPPPKAQTNPRVTVDSPFKRSTPRRKHVAKRKTISKGGKSKGNQKRGTVIDEDCVGDAGWSSDSDVSELGVDFVAEEEDFTSKEGTKEVVDEFVHFTPRDVTKAVVDAFRNFLGYSLM